MIQDDSDGPTGANLGASSSEQKASSSATRVEPISSELVLSSSLITSSSAIQVESNKSFVVKFSTGHEYLDEFVGKLDSALLLCEDKTGQIIQRQILPGIDIAKANGQMSFSLPSEIECERLFYYGLSSEIFSGVNDTNLAAVSEFTMDAIKNSEVVTMWMGRAYSSPIWVGQNKEIVFAGGF